MILVYRFRNTFYLIILNLYWSNDHTFPHFFSAHVITTPKPTGNYICIYHSASIVYVCVGGSFWQFLFIIKFNLAKSTTAPSCHHCVILLWNLCVPVVGHLFYFYLVSTFYCFSNYLCIPTRHIRFVSIHSTGWNGEIIPTWYCCCYTMLWNNRRIF